jgi:hypothetical protein
MEVYLKHTGGYMSKESRDGVARELRSTHFKLGGYGPDYTSAYKTNFAGTAGGP